MRSDLTPAFIAAKNAAFRKPRQLLVFHFPEAGDVYISDQEITLGGRAYLPMVEDWGELTDSANQEDATGEILQCTLTLWNGGENPFSDYFLQEDPENVEVDLYQWFAGLADSDKALIDRFVVQDPIEFDEVSRLLRLDLVSVAMRYDGRIGPVLTAEDWPYAKTSDIGKGVDLIVGSPGRVKTLCARTAPECRLNGSIIPGTMRIDINVDDGNLNDLGFSASGKIQIDGEIIIYGSRGIDYFNVSWRGVDGTDATTHSDGATVILFISDHTYLVGQGPVASITDVRIAGRPAPASWFSVYPWLNPARIVFNRKPTYTDFLNTRTSNVYFDDVTGNNTAMYPHYAFWKEHRSEGAVLDSGHQTLALVQNDPISDHGEVVNIFLNVTHWSTKFYTVEQVRVWVEGIGDIGALSRPNPEDKLDLAGEVDVDHEHKHTTGDYHSHTFNNPAYDVNDHEHDTGRQDISYGPNNFTFPDKWYAPYEDWITFDPSWVAPDGVVNNSWSGAAITVKAYLNGATLRMYGNGGALLKEWPFTAGGEFNIDDLIPITVGKNVYFMLYGHAVGAYVYITETNVILYEAIMRTKEDYPAVSPYVSTSGSNVETYNTNKPDDVEKLEELDAEGNPINRPLEFTDNEPGTRTVTDSFDITDHLTSVDWSWFQGREVRLIFNTNGGTTGVSIIVTYMVFEVEYREKQTITSDDITATVTGSVDSSPEAVASYLLTNNAELPATRIDSAVFAATRTRYASLGYKVDGVLPAGLSVRDALKKICFETRSRLIWTGGYAKMILRETQANWSADKSILPQNIQLRSIKARRQRVDALVNVITMLYHRDWTMSDSDEPYTESISLTNESSSDRNGIKEDRDRWRMDLIGSETMAFDVAAYYLDLLSTPSTFYEFAAYLDQFDLEKEDKIELTSAGFASMSKVPMVIRGISRQFGSGKNKQINLIRILAENLRYILLKLSAEDSVHVMDALTILVADIVDLSEAVHVIEQLFAKLDVSRADEAVITDTLLKIVDWNKVFSETVTAGDVTLGEMEALREDQVVVEDFPEFWSVYGYGAGGYGQVPYGGLTAYRQKNPDQIYAFDRLLTVIAARQASEIQAEDALMISSGYGGKLSSGYGLSPYGA